MSEELLTVKEAANRLKIHPQTVREWLRDDKLRGLRMGDNGRWRVPESAIVEALSGSNQKTGAGA